MNSFEENLLNNDVALRRLKILLDNTLSNDDGDAIFQSIAAISEAFAILYQANVMSKSEFIEFMDIASHNGKIIGKVRIGEVKADEKRDIFEFTTKTEQKTDLSIEVLY